MCATETGTAKRPFTVNSQRERFAECFECAGAAAILLFLSRLQFYLIAIIVSMLNSRDMRMCTLLFRSFCDFFSLSPYHSTMVHSSLLIDTVCPSHHFDRFTLASFIQFVNQVKAM